MDKPFKFRRAREIAGCFVLAMFVLLGIGIATHGQIRGWFGAKTFFEVVLPSKGSQGIQRGSAVHILGSRAGKVREIQMRRRGDNEKLTSLNSVPRNEIELVAILEVRGPRSVFVGKDSKAILKRDLAGFGSSFFELTRGDDTWDSESLAHRKLQFDIEADVKEEMTEIAEEIRNKLVPALEEIESLAKDLNREDGGFQSSLAGLSEIVQKVQSGEGTIGTMVNDEKAEADFRKSLANFSKASEELTQSMEQINELVTSINEGEGAAGRLFRNDDTEAQLDRTLGNIDEASASMNSSLAKIDTTVEQFPDVLDNLNTAFDEFEDVAQLMQGALKEYDLLARGAQEHPLLRKSVNRAREKGTAPQNNSRPPRKAPARWAGKSKLVPTSGKGIASRKNPPAKIIEAEKRSQTVKTSAHAPESLGDGKPSTKRPSFPFLRKLKLRLASMVQKND